MITMPMFEVADELALSVTSSINITTGFAGLPNLFVVARATDQSSGPDGRWSLQRFVSNSDINQMLIDPAVAFGCHVYSQYPFLSCDSRKVKRPLDPRYVSEYEVTEN